MAQASDYIGIKLWHQSTGSHPYYWESLQATAAATDAPLDAIYQGFTSHRWACVSELAPGHPFHALYSAALASAREDADGKGSGV